MEVDLTEDDVVFTTSSNMPKKTNKQTPPMETIEISDDEDDLIEIGEAAKEKLIGNSSVETAKKVNDKHTEDDHMVISSDDDDDDVVEVVEPSSQVQTQKKGNVTSNKKDQMEVDDVIEVVEPNSTGSTKDTPKPTGRKGLPVKSIAHSIAPQKPEVKNMPKQSQKEADDIIEVVERTNPKTPLETGSSVRGKATSASAVPLVQSNRASDKRYVVDITDENCGLAKRRAESNCLNILCKSGLNLAMAPMFVASYYGCKLKKGLHQVCAECFDNAVSHHKNLTKMLIDKKSLFSYENFFVNDITVVDLDSDEETSKPEDPLPLSVLQVVEENLEDVLKDALAKCDLDFQMKEAEGFLTSKISTLELQAKNIDDEYDKLQKEIDAMRYEVYRAHNPIIRELPSIDIPFASPSTPFKHPLTFGNVPRPFPGPPRGVAVKKVTAYRNPPPRPEGSSQEVVALEQQHYCLPETPLPPIGNLMRPKPRANDVVYVMKMSFFGVWLKGRVMEVMNNGGDGAPLSQTLYKVRMEAQGNRKISFKTVPGKHLAYPNPSAVRLNVGTRVIAVFHDEESSNPYKGGAYYSGLIAEPPKSNNRFRYLVFFDDGYAQYVPHHKILVVCESSRNVEDDIHPDSREFIRKYLQKYPERPMVKLAANQSVKTEWNGKWWLAHVVQVDGSLVKMSFEADKRTEWIYRGSTRLAPLYTQLVNQQARQESGGTGTISRMRGLGVQRINQPYVEYTQNVGAEDDVSESQAPTPSTTVRAVAKKSTAKKHETPTSHIQSYRPNFFNPDQVGIVKELQLPKDAPMPKRFQSHTCGPHCIDWIRYDRIKMGGYNPLSIPLLCGWQREVPKFRKKTSIMYTAPCGRRVRSMHELHKYLRLCKSKMSVDLFDFDYWVNALSQFTLQDKLKKFIVEKDISNGMEKVRIPLVNYVDNTLPNKLTYKNERQPYENVPLNTDKEFLCGCNCTDDCQNKEKCACWQLTIQGSSLYPGGVPDPSVGYYYKRLQERVITGIYECNPQCKCSKTTCLNRVVQHPLQLQLQLFKTVNKGWGLRCINDIPKGTFICIYAGYLYTEQTANKVGEQDGDDYLAELDYIEVVERMKEDYESDVEDDLDDDEETPRKLGKDSVTENKRSSWNRNKEESDSDFRAVARPTSDTNADETIRSRLRKRTAADLDSSDKGAKRRESSLDVDDDGSDDDKLERLPSSFTPKPLKKPGKVVEPAVHRFQSVRKFFGPNERVYIMDANKVGNIGRYLNHSCSPNVFVQNVFVDTHDLRFPWVAFFALNYIRAGEELTWDYNYDVGSVPDKQIFCQCGSSECRGRLL